MFNVMVTKVKRAFAVVRFGLLILRWCGPRMCISKTMHQLYGQTIFLVTKMADDRPSLSSDSKYTVRLASPDDVKELFSGLRTESPEGRYQLLVRKWYYERGFSDCYITRTTDTNEICHVSWMVTPKHVKQAGWEDRFPLDEDEVMGENIYTFERFRGKGANQATGKQMREFRNQRGYNRAMGYIDVKNTVQRRSGERRGTLVRASVLERHFLFHVTRRILERYDPPVPMISLKDIK